MKWIRESVVAGEKLFGTWLILGSSVTAEMAGTAGFDWCLLDMEHGLGGYTELLHQMQALSGTNAAPIIRITNNDPLLIKRALDLGASGIMVPCVNKSQDAEMIVKAMKYPPEGFRGMDSGSRATLYGSEFKDYYPKTQRDLLTVVQIESGEGVENADMIAAVDGVDVLFIGHADLSLDLGHFMQLDHPEIIAAENKVVEACKKHNKTAGLLLKQAEDVPKSIDKGYDFIAVGTDLSMLNKALIETVDFLKPF